MPTHRNKRRVETKKGFRLSESSGIFRQRYREALEAAIQRAEKDQENNARHGPVKVLAKDGKPIKEPQ